MAKNAHFLKQIVKEISDEYTSIAEDAVSSAEFTGYIDTGSLTFNAQLSGSIYGGMPNNKVLALAGEQAVGKTFFALGIMKHFLEINDNSGAVWYLAEPAVTKKMLIERGIDPSRIMIAEPATVQQFRNQALKTIDAYIEIDKRPPMMMILDSLGALSTTKELEDSTNGKDTRDMTRAQLIRGTFRTITLKLARAQIPMIVTNHTYDSMSMYSPKEMSGGGGLKYAGDQIAFLSKSKDRDEKTKEVLGNIIHIKMFKNRIAKENTSIDVRLDYEKGLDRYYGLAPIAVKYGIFTKKSKGYEIDGKDVSTKDLIGQPEKYYTEEVLTKVDAACKLEFEYGKKGISVESEVEEEVE